jgi:Ca2+-binding EF-hand superfamily protein
MLENIRAQIAKRGGLNGIRSLGRSFRIMDDGGNGKIEPEEMLYGLRDQGVEVERNEIEQIMLHFDKDGDGSVIFDEFLRALRGKMNQRRKGLVKLAFGQLDKTGDGVVTMEDLMGIYDVSENPDVINGLLTPDQAFQEFAKVWDRDRSGSVHLDEFIDYYQDVSASIDNDDYFELMIRNAWHISGGEGQYENTANLRVLVIHDDGSQEVVEIKDDLGLDVNDFPAIRKKLFMQGVKNIKKVEVASAM